MKLCYKNKNSAVFAILSIQQELIKCIGYTFIFSCYFDKREHVLLPIAFLDTKPYKGSTIKGKNLLPNGKQILSIIINPQ